LFAYHVLVFPSHPSVHRCMLGVLLHWLAILS
jgi:hypothetical protein